MHFWSPFSAFLFYHKQVIFSLITDNDNLSIKLKAFDNSQINITEGNYIIEEATASTTLAYTSVINTQNTQATDAPANFNLETTSTPSLIEIYGVVTTEKDPLNLRNLPSIDSDVIAKIPKGEKVSILSEDGEWLRVKYADLDGYVSKQYILLSDDDPSTSYVDDDNIFDKKSGIVITEKDPLNVRQSPSVDSKKLGTVPKGGQVVIISEDGDWFEIEYGSGSGYVSKKYISTQN